MKTISADDLDGKVFRTSKSRWFKSVSPFLYNEFGRLSDLDKNESIVEICDKWPILMENDLFQMVTPFRRDLKPYEPILFSFNNGVRFKVELNNYRISIPFHFNSKDERVGITQAIWSSPGGKLLYHLRNQYLSISFDENNVPVLDVGFGRMKVRNQ